mmetsp:Transcript_122148/g.353173  ORF Transcript_122148/g.353173 Transcript_122148/m.353173 type:complete len:287 (-) Transcript_122148:801-1661(-)
MPLILNLRCTSKSVDRHRSNDFLEGRVARDMHTSVRRCPQPALHLRVDLLLHFRLDGITKQSLLAHHPRVAEPTLDLRDDNHEDANGKDPIGRLGDSGGEVVLRRYQCHRELGRHLWNSNYVPLHVVAGRAQDFGDRHVPDCCQSVVHLIVRQTGIIHREHPLTLWRGGALVEQVHAGVRYLTAEHAMHDVLQHSLRRIRRNDAADGSRGAAGVNDFLLSVHGGASEDGPVRECVCVRKQVLPEQHAIVRVRRTADLARHPRRGAKTTRCIAAVKARPAPGDAAEV